MFYLELKSLFSEKLENPPSGVKVTPNPRQIHSSKLTRWPLMLYRNGVLSHSYVDEQ